VSVLNDAQLLLTFALGLAALGMEVFALVDAARHAPQAYQLAEKRTKNFWLIVLGLCAVVGFVSMWNVLSLVGLLAVVGAGIYLTDVRPALRTYRGRRDARGSGPYGSW
jgi:lysylphosphatidylglycerol synthetase-like protein (DUF2156 family)